MTIRPYLDKVPSFGQKVMIDEDASIIGDVRMADDVSIWAFASLRGDVNYIEIGARTNIQEGTIIHVTHQSEGITGWPTIIGEDVTIGHGVMLHGCKIADASLIGMRATILDGAEVGKHSILGACSLLPPRKKIPEGELWMGTPAVFVRKLSDKEIEHFYYSSNHYVELKNNYLSMVDDKTS